MYDSWLVSWVCIDIEKVNLLDIYILKEREERKNKNNNKEIEKGGLNRWREGEISEEEEEEERDI